MTAAGLRVLGVLPRAALAAAGLCGVAVAAFPVDSNDATGVHLLATAVGISVLAIWPALTICGTSVAPAACRTRWAISATVAMCVLLRWTLYETRHGPIVGLAERVVVCAEMLWPVVVIATARRVSVSVPEPSLPDRRSACSDGAVLGAPDAQIQEP